MIIEINVKNYVLQDRLKNLIEKKLEKVGKYFDEDVKARVMLKAYQIHKTAELFSMEINILFDGAIIRAEASNPDMYANIDLVVPKLEKQIVKHRARIEAKSKKFRVKSISEAEAKEAEAFSTVVKSKTYELIPMTVEEAIEEQELVGHNFYVFLNKATKLVSVLYRRNDGDYGLIEAVTA